MFKYSIADQRMYFDGSDYGYGKHDWECFSGWAAHRTEPWLHGKGPIPPSELIVGEYRVATTGYFHPALESVAFAISPNPIVCKDDPSLSRSDLFFHVDGGVPKVSAGCCVFAATDFLSVVHLMGQLSTRFADVGLEVV
jgi:hypothetical protein